MLVFLFFWKMCVCVWGIGGEEILFFRFLRDGMGREIFFKGGL